MTPMRSHRKPPEVGKWGRRKIEFPFLQFFQKAAVCPTPPLSPAPVERPGASPACRQGKETGIATSREGVVGRGWRSVAGVLGVLGRPQGLRGAPFPSAAMSVVKAEAGVTREARSYTEGGKERRPLLAAILPPLPVGVRQSQVQEAAELNNVKGVGAGREGQR